MTALLTATPWGATSAYQTYGTRTTSGTVAELKWSRLPVRYFVTDRGAAGVSADAFRAAAARAFATWEAVPSASVSAQFVGFTSATPGDEDGQVTLGFLARRDLDRVLGATSFLIDEATGAIVESDIFFNTAFDWSVASAGESGRFDLESIILHETGHLFGLGHSALGETELRASGGRRVIAAEAVMFPIAFSAGNISGRVLKADDIAGISQLYPRAGFRQESGAITGRVTRDGRGVFGAHVVAFNPETGALVGNFSVDDSGSFGITGLSPGPYIIRVEPVDDADLESFFDEDGIARVDLGFRVTYARTLAVVPRGGGAVPVQITVTAK
jgi:hypothetical protein